MKDSTKKYMKQYSEFANYPNNPLIKQGQKALDQCLAPVMDNSVKLRKNIVNKFSDKGRAEHVQELVDFPCVITPMGATTGTSSAGGTRSTTKFTVMVTPPATLQIGDILEHATYGVMKIVEFDGYGNYGLTSAVAVKLGAGNNVTDGDAVRAERKTYW